MTAGRPALTGAERKRRHIRRVREGMTHVRADLPCDVGTWLLEMGFKVDDNSMDPDEWGEAVIEALRWAMQVPRHPVTAFPPRIR
jgi:hypothetical protein